MQLNITDEKSKVSSHYFIKNNGEILSLVPDLYIACGSFFMEIITQTNIVGIDVGNPGQTIRIKFLNYLVYS